MSAYAVSARGLAGRKVPQGVLTPMGDLLFSASEPGAWYDPSDMSTLFQDSAGTTPVTAVEQPVGRMLDKSGRGNHALQATTTKRPIYSRRVNLLTKTEDLGASNWAKGAATTSGRKVVEDTSVNSHSVYQLFAQQPGGYTARFKIKSAGRNFAFVQLLVDLAGTAKRYCVIVDLVTGLVTQTTNVELPSGTSCAVQSLGGGVWNVSASINQTVSGSMAVFVGPSNSGTPALSNGAPSYLGDGASGVEAWDAELIASHQAVLPYQLVNTATDYDADPAKFPAYLRFDGVDDAMVSVGNVDLSGTDKVTAWVGVNVSSSSDQSGIFELGTNSTTSNGLSIQCMGAQFTALRGQAFGTSRGVVDAGGFAPNTTYQICAQYDLAAALVKDEIRLRKNGVYGSTPTLESSGTGNFSSAPLTLMARGYMATYTGGRFYGLIVRGSATGTATLEAVERYMNSKVRAY